MTPKLITWIDDLRECVCEYLEKYGQGGTCFCGVWPGANITWDYCGDCGKDTCGMAYIQPGFAAPYASFPYQDLDQTCVRDLFYEIEVGIVRCMPTMGDDGELPSASEVTNAAYGLMLDQNALRCAIQECKGNALVAIDAWTPAGPQGGCVGGAWSIYVDPR